jgi:methylenetetrahydrofolate dehydrogenase (NADP+)/methenyltetrahydrofolate cyclohydrolase
VTGIFLHSPLPEGLNLQEAQYQIDVLKDVEGVNPANIGHVVYGHTIIAPCTALAVMELIASTGTDLTGKEVAVVGASRIVGRPLALLLTEKNATVTLCHIHTQDTAAHCREADVVVVAVGKPGLIRAGHVKPGAVVIDVGINRVKITDAFGKVTEKTVGDVDFEEVAEVASWITPVPGGVGPMTVAILLRNTLRAARLVHGVERPFAG